MNEKAPDVLLPEEELPPVGPKTAMVSVIGRPSVGKSTFLNTASGEKISIVSSVPQTTRNAIRGIVNTSLGQLVFIDTPGLHESDKKLNLKLTQIAADQMKESDAILYIIDSTREHGSEEEMIASMVAPYKDKMVIAINKTEDPRAQVSDARAFVQHAFPDFSASKVVEMSAKDDVNVNDVLKALYDLAPEAPHLYPEEFYTDQEVDFRIAEIIRGQAINRLEQELPHAIYVNIQDMKMEKANLLKVRAVLCVERDSQKGIVIGKGASMIKAIRVDSIKECRKIFPYRVDIDLQVKVDKNWRQKDATLNRLLK
ncbi:MAG: GTPase Era [Treponema sp.]|nr:GTPase Era [Treponema sp.]